MKTATRPQYHRLQRILELIREGTRTGSLPNCGHFIRELEVSRRSLMRDLDFLRDDHHAPIAYDDSRKGFYLTDPTFSLPAGAMPPGRLPRQLVPFGAQHRRWPQGNLCPLALPLPRRHRAALPEPRRVRPESGRIREPLVLRRSADFSRLNAFPDHEPGRLPIPPHKFELSRLKSALRQRLANAPHESLLQRCLWHQPRLPTMERAAALCP